MAEIDSKLTAMPADRESLYAMIQLKLDRFKQSKVRCEKEYSEITKHLNDNLTSLVDKVQILTESVQKLFPHSTEQQNFNELLTIANSNTSTSNGLLENFSKRLMKIIEGGKRRSEYNYLLGLILSQWFSSQDNESLPVTKESTSTNYLAAHERLQTIIFDRPQLDLNQWRQFVQNKLFSHFDSNRKLQDGFAYFKSDTHDYGRQLRTEKVSSSDIQRAMQSLIKDGSLGEGRKRLIEKLRLDENAVAEFASSVTLMMADLDDWNWPTEGVRGIFRRNIVGKYRCFYEEDFLTAIFLEHVGLKWSFHFKEQLQRLFTLLTEKLEDECSSKSIQNERIVMQQKNFWMASLPSVTESSCSYIESSSHGACLKAKLLHLINVEIQLHQTIRPNSPFSVVCADLEWFGPSISHEVVQIFLEHCGVSKEWLAFFDRFLKQPIFYKHAESVRQRQRGVPISHSLSFLFSELLLFGMDLYVYHSTGIFNYRLHDDFWFFDSQTSKVEQAWTLMNEYAQMIGLKLNEEKCGSVLIRSSDQLKGTDANNLLPKKSVKWGLLTLRSTGRFVVDLDSVKPFLDEMKTRLANASTILKWVTLYNQYMAFFQRNFGPCANILGLFHVQQIIETFQSIHRYVFEETNGNALTMLTNRIREQFPGYSHDEFLEAWFYWPLAEGGLGLKNIFLTLHSVHKQLLRERGTTFDQLPKKDIEVYAELKEDYDRSKQCPYPKFQSSYEFVERYVAENKQLMTFEEFILKRESYLYYWKGVYKTMLELTEPSLPSRKWTLKTRTNRSQSPSRRRQRQSQQDETYEQWLRYYYAEQIESSFERLDFVDHESLPMGLITTMKKSEINWDEESE